ncbi:MAG TPA: glycoside hydrolase family 43 protein [Burkholderiales bacterium]|nr:glycoside hydrolase family 43 protein [Burkholderiales bacterium]
MTGVRLAAFSVVLLSACATLSELPYRNPVLDQDFPDPAVLRAPDGWFYAYATQSAVAGRMLNIQSARSRDLLHWEHLGDALPDKPHWAAGKQDFWAPHVLYDKEQDRYIMYYSAEPEDAKGKCLAVATARAARGPFVDSGTPLLCGRGIEHIDPMAFEDPKTGQRLLLWGSGGMPIRAQELSPDRLRFLPGSAPVELVAADSDKPYRSLIEGAWMTYRDGWYYLYFSGDRCCARAPRYAIMVARARQPLGPFEHYEGDQDGSGAILVADERWLAPGHNSIVSDAAGNDWIAYHAYHARRFPAGDRRRVMLIDRIVYRDGWPTVSASQSD